MSYNFETYLRQQITNINQTKIDNDFNRILGLCIKIINSFESGGTLAFIGNGGSAAEANHLAAEFTGKCLLEHKPLKAISLCENTSSLTAIANDFGNEFIFSRQVEALLDSNSILIAMSTSGSSGNVLTAIKMARELGIYTVLWTGQKFLLTSDTNVADEVWIAPTPSTPRIQEIHLMWGHLVAECVELYFASVDGK